MKDQEMEKLIKLEAARQKRVINLIASENYVSKDVLTALGSELTNKYAEGYSTLRYYGGNEVVDQIENLVKKRALKLFKLSPKNWAVNVQPLSGSPANLAVYTALVPLGEKIMAMKLDHGGHLTHGHKVSLTGKIWNFVHYGVDRDSERLDYNEIKKIAQAEKPQLIVTGYTAYPRKIDFKKFREIADACPNPQGAGRGSYLMVDMSHFAGLVAGGVYPSPFKYADVVTTTTHKTLRGPRAALIFSRKAPARHLASRLTVKEGNSSAQPMPRPHQIPSLKQDSGLHTLVPNPSSLIPHFIDKAIFPGLQGGPHLNQIAAVGVALQEAMSPAFKTYAKQVVKNAKVLARELEKRGWRLVSGGTDSHLILVDVWQDGKGIGGREASERLEQAGIIVNKNTIPFDTRSPQDPSGIRLGTAAETTRGKTEADMIKITQRIDQILRSNG